MPRFSYAIAVALLLLAACSSSVNQLSQADQLSQKYAQQNHQVHRVDVGKGQQHTPAAMVLTLNMPASDNFKTQADNGGEAKDHTHVNGIEVFLYEVSGGTPPAAGTCPGAAVDLAAAGSVKLMHRQLLTPNLTAAGPNWTQTVIFENIPSNTNLGDKYFIAARAMQSSANITSCSDGYKQDAGTFDSITITSNGPVGLSTQGHEVSTNYTVTPGAPQTIQLSLLDAVGAKLDAVITVEEGDTTLPDISAN